MARISRVAAPPRQRREQGHVRLDLDQHAPHDVAVAVRVLDVVAVRVVDVVGEPRAERDLCPGNPFNFNMTVYESMRAIFVSSSRELVQK